MRRLKSIHSTAVIPQDVLDDLYGNFGDFGIANEADIVSVSVLPTESTVRIVGPRGSEMPRYEVVVVYWSDQR